ncbi:MAG: RadC family protein [Clostridia bacterium]|nr:RadC family protein [Clostridia bacterium]
MEEKPRAHPHGNHRERVRSLFLKSGLDGFSEHGVLELLLFYTIPQGDTNMTAHNLIDAFGSLQGVLDAPVEELKKVKGVGEYTAVFLSVLPQLARRYCAGKASDRISLFDREALARYVCSLFIGMKTEHVFLLSFDGSGQLNNTARLSEGGITQIDLDNRKIMEAALRGDAVNVVLAHNHPGGVAVPSAADASATQGVANLLTSVGIRLRDHMIVSGTDCFSMAGSPRYMQLFV